MNIITRSIVYIVITVVIIATAWALSPTRANNIGIIFLPSGQHFSPVDPEHVAISDKAPLHGQTVGVINLQFYDKTPDNATIKMLEQTLMMVAAQQGANHLVIEQFGQNPVENTIIVQAQALRG